MSTSRNTKHLIFGLLLLGYFAAYFFRVSTSVVLPDIQRDWGLSASLIGFISSMYFYPYSAMQPVCGVFNDRLGPSRVVSIGFFITGAGSILFGMASTPAMLIAGRLLIGAGLAPMFSGLMVFQGARYHPSRYTLLSGFSLMAGNMGAVCSVAPLSISMDAWGRQAVFSGLALGIFVAAAVLFIASTLDKFPETFTPARNTSVRQQFKDALAAIRECKDLRRVTIIWTTISGSILSIQGLWAVSWFSIAYGLSNSDASLAATMIGIGVMSGNLAGGQFGRNPRTQHHRVACCIFTYLGIWALVILCFALRAPVWLTTTAVTLLGIGCGMGSVQCMIALHTLSPAGLGGSILGMANTVIISSVIVYQWGTGILIELFTPTGNSANLNSAYVLSFLAVAASLVTSCICASRLNPFKK